MRYCTQCVMPDTKPYLTFDEKGVCAACQAHATKYEGDRAIDWEAREQQFVRLLEEVKAQKAPYYDVLVPVSGGKDSITQVHRLLGHGLRILTVNVDYGIKTEIGHYNLQCIPAMGANLFTYRPELQLHKELIRIGFEQYGDPDLMSHTMLHAAPLHTGLMFKVPLILLGENSAFEYGGDASLSSLSGINKAWFMKYAANGGRDAEFVSRTHGISMDRLTMYAFPDALEGSGTKAVFSGYFFRWDSEEHFRIAQTYGFRALDEPREGTYRTYVGIDEIINRIHQYFKVLKFGYGRATDHACEDIRAGRLNRDEARELVRRYDLQPVSDEYVDAFCAFLDRDRDWYEQVMERYRNGDIWKKDDYGRWYIPGHLEEA